MSKIKLAYITNIKTILKGTRCLKLTSSSTKNVLSNIRICEVTGIVCPANT